STAKVVVDIASACIHNFFFQAEDGIRDYKVTGVQTCALPIYLNQALVEAEIPDAGFHLSSFDQEGPVTGHSREDLFIRINFADVPQPGDEDSALRAGDHLLGCLLTAGREKHDVGRRFAHLIGQGEPMTAYLDLAYFPGKL